MVKTRIAVLISGGGTNLQALIDAQKDGVLRHGRLVLVVSSNSIAYGLKRAEDAGIETAVGTKKQAGSQEACDAGILKALQDHDIDMIVLAGFMQILSADFVRHYEKRIINVHPSLIPSFCGKGAYGLRVHEMALEYGVKVTGATVHYVNEVPDGGQIIMQKPVMVKKNDTPKILQKRVMAEAEWQILPQAAEKVAKRLMMEKTARTKQYQIADAGALLADNAYPGRGILLGQAKTSGKAVCAYFIMGRSDNSRNRVFTLKDGELFTEPFDPSKVEDPSLIIYAALRKYENNLIVTNGDQTDTIYEFLEADKTFEQALQTRQFEPDHPNLTPRISGRITCDEKGDAPAFASQRSILKSEDPDGNRFGRYTYCYEPEAGLGHFIHTYECDGNPLPTFAGEPERVSIPDDIDTFTDELWRNLNASNKISLYVRYTDPKTGEYDERLINKNEK
ncbi:MAG: phosphoribosylglycinamide formyltransferase [Firmicutes bacterium]|nr:phosphoribosylglycinamide formyltransferase [Bacillota bacterium]